MKLWHVAVPLIAIVCFGSVIGINMYKEKKTLEYLANRKPVENPISVMTMQNKPWQESISAIGYIEPNQGIDITAESSGSITGLFFDSGYMVKEGQILVQINDSVEQAELKAAQAKATAAEKKYIRYMALIKKGNISQQDLDNAEADYESAKADIGSIESQINKLRIKAPFDGKLGIRNVYKGQFLSSGDKITHLEDSSKVKVRFAVSQNNVNKIKIGQEIQLTADAFPGEIFKGKISALEVYINYEAGLLQVQATIPNTGHKLITGMYTHVDVMLPLLNNQMIIPETAAAFNLYGTNVFLVHDSKDSNGKDIKTVTSQTIKTGSRRDGNILVTEGLKQGDVVVTEGQVRLSSGSLVKINDNFKLDKPAKAPQL